ncbi:hypothetical protein VCRLGP8_1430732 [Vibrio crassostreae]|nr:hypothetical protein VCRLGP8_1430732 [Vibrio crassostreae]CDT44641.1 hypothetical protein VCRLGP7_720081 [Vibrio crassostreae]CDT66534.1 hypothetical protein VCRLGP107_760727 [Vibrio crassostreae]
MLIRTLLLEKEARMNVFARIDRLRSRSNYLYVNECATGTRSLCLDL